MAKIGILGGTFDPIHNGHLKLGAQARDQIGLDQVWFMPSGHPPHKRDHHVTEGRERREMVELAIAGIPGFVYSGAELAREGNTYTAQTLSLLHRQYPAQDFYFIIGADSLYEIETWYHPELVMSQCTLVAAGRPCRYEHIGLEEQAAYLRERYGAKVVLLHFDEIDISSEEIRRLAGEGRAVDAYVPAPVDAYIREHGLYRGGCHDGKSIQ